MLGRLSGLEELAVNSDDVDRRMAFAMIGKRLTQLPPSWANLTQARFLAIPLSDYPCGRDRLQATAAFSAMEIAAYPSLDEHNSPAAVQGRCARCPCSPPDVTLLATTCQRALTVSFS